MPPIGKSVFPVVGRPASPYGPAQKTGVVSLNGPVSVAQLLASKPGFIQPSAGAELVYAQLDP